MPSTRTSEALRIAYWRGSMDHARRFIELMMAANVRECNEGMVSIQEAATSAGVHVEYSDTPIVDGIPRIFEVREGIIPSLLTAAREMNERNWVLKIEDGFRTADMQRRLALKPEIFDAILQKATWESESREPSIETVIRRVSVLIAMSPKVAGHMAGCAVDISVLDRDTGVEVDRGAPYLEMSELTPMACPFIPPEALQRRAMITAIMESYGFAAYPFEFWHYSQGDVFAEYIRCTGAAGRYAAVHRDPADGSIDPVEDLLAPLHDATSIRDRITQARRRIRVPGAR